MEMLAHLKARRTVRRFRPEPIPEEVRSLILEAGMWAPSHGNTQPWEFVLVGPQARSRLLVLLKAKAEELLAVPDLPPPRRAAIESLREDFGGAALLVAVVSRPPADDLEAFENPLSAAAAVQNMCLAAWSAGVGAVWLSMGAAPPARQILEVEREASVVALLAMGFPAEQPPAPPRDAASDHLRRVP